MDFIREVHIETKVIKIAEREFKIILLMNGTQIDEHGFKGFKEVTTEMKQEVESEFIYKWNL
jgi:hypothetical protein